MKSENEDQRLIPLTNRNDTTGDFHKKSKFSYTRDFLFSFAESDACKKLPTGFDASVLRDLDDQSICVLQSSHVSDAARFQSNLWYFPRPNFEEGILGSGAFARVHRGVTETCIPVLQSRGCHLLNQMILETASDFWLVNMCYGADAGRFQSSPYFPLQNFEEGLLGSGAFPKVHRDVAETCVPVLQCRGSNLLNRSSEPYRPPHLYKAYSCSGRESKDQYNDETFGCCNLGQERVEEEKMRRDSFNLMRKEQEKDSQEKPKITCDEQKENFGQDIDVVMEDSRLDKKGISIYSKCKGSEPCNVKGHSDNAALFSADLNHQFLKIEKMTDGDHKVTELDSAKFSSGTTGIAHNLKKSASTSVRKEISTELYSSCNSEVLSYDCFKESSLSEINGLHSSQHCLINRRSSYLIDDSRPSCYNSRASSQHFPSLLQNEAGLTYVAGSSKLNMWSLDKPFVSDAGNHNHLLNQSGEVCINKFEKNGHEPISRKVVKGSQLIASSGTQIDFTSRYPLPAENIRIPLTVNEPRSVGVVEEIVSSGLSKNDSNPFLSDAKVEVDLQVGPEPEHNSLSNFDELDICLPDEDSLITVDDYMPPQNTMFVTTEDTSCAQFNTLGKVADCGVAVYKKQFDLAGFESPFPVHGFHDIVCLESYLKRAMCMKQSHPEPLHSQLKTAKAQKGSRTKPPDFKTCPYNLQSLQHCPTNAHLTPSQHLRTVATGFHRSANPQLVQELLIPGNLPLHQMYRQRMIASSQNISNEMAGYAYNKNATPNPLKFNQQCYGDS